MEIGLADFETVKDFQTLKDWVGLKDGESRKSSTKIARGFEAYLMEGKAPSFDLVDAFSRIRNWMVNICKSIRGLQVNISDEIRGVFD